MIDIEARTAFKDISKLYDKARISYPDELIEKIIRFSRLQKGDNVLDIGCGTGQATILFAKRGFNVVGLDIGEELVSVAREKCSSFNNVKFKVGFFEKVEFSKESFDLITCAMAWHWINPEGREEKACKILKTQGTMALFWSYQRKQESIFVQDISKVLDKYGGINRGPAGSRVKDIADSLCSNFKENQLFEEVKFCKFEENINFTKEKYCNLIFSYGWVQKLSEEKKSQLLRDIEEVLSNYDESINVPYKHILILAKKK